MPETERKQMNFKGNREHLDVLLYAMKKNNIGFWNTWREKNSDVNVVLTGANLSEAVLTGANFAGANLREANLSGSELSGVNLTEADLSGADLSEASLIDAELTEAVLNGTYLYEANCAGAQCRETIFSNVNLSKASLKGAHLDLAKIHETDLTDSDLCNCSLVKATLENVTFTGAFIYAWNIKDWETKNLTCNYIYIDDKGKERLPKKRNFRKGEFEGYIKKLHAPPKEYKKTKSRLPEGRALYHVFISYVNEDDEYVNMVAIALEMNGVKVWLDKERLQPGIQWQKALRAAIENGIYFIACFSKNYCKKVEADTNEELKIALERLKKIPNDRAWFIPIKILLCEIPDKKIGPGQMLTSLQCIDLTKGWEEGIKRIVEVIKGE